MNKQESELLQSIDSRLQDLEEKIAKREELDAELLDLFQAVKGSLTVLRGIERMSIWLAKMSVAAGILWFIFKYSVEEALKSMQRGGQ